jgi:TolA-binding protein
MDTVMFWAAVASPIVGVIAIIVAFIVSNSTTKKIQKQVDAVYELMDVFVAAQNPTMMEAKKKYEQQLAQLDQQIEVTKDDIETIRHPFRFVNRLEAAEAAEDQLKRIQNLECLFNRRKEVEESLGLIQSYIQKATKK